VWAAHPWDSPNSYWSIAGFGWTASGVAKGFYPDYLWGSTGFQINPSSASCLWYVTQGPHPGAMQVGLGDGSVRGVSAGVSGTTWNLACTPNDGNALPADW
jgi:hypothetical protein